MKTKPRTKTGKNLTTLDGLEGGQILTPAQFCKRIGLGRSTFSTWRREYGFPVRDIGKGGLIYTDDVLEWIAKQKLKPQNAAKA